MTNQYPLIEQKLAELELKFPVSKIHPYTGTWVNRDKLDTFLTIALKEALLAGVELAEEIVCDGRHTSYEERKDNTPYSMGVIDGHRCANDRNSAKLQALKQTLTT